MLLKNTNFLEKGKIFSNSVVCIIILIENRNFNEHFKNLLYSLIKEIYKTLNSKESKDLLDTISSLLIENLNDEDYQKKSYEMLCQLIKSKLKSFPDHPGLILFISYIYHFRLKNKFLAVSELQHISENNIRHRFSAYRIKSVIESEMVEDEKRKIETTELDIGAIIDFQRKYDILKNALIEVSNLYQEFWEELYQEKPFIKKLQNLGTKITNSLDKTRENFTNLTRTNPNHIKTLIIYGNFLTSVQNDHTEAKKILYKVDYITKSVSVNKQFMQEKHLRYGENSNCQIFIVSGDPSSLGSILNVNSEVLRGFSLDAESVKKTSINLFMPKIYADHHDSFIKNYFTRNKNKYMDSERDVYALDTEGFICPSNLLIRILPSVQDGIKIIGLLKQNQLYFHNNLENINVNSDSDDHFILYNVKTGVIYGITKNCYLNFGIKPEFIYGKFEYDIPLNLDMIFKGLVSDEKLAELQSNNGIIYNIDTTQVMQEFFLEYKKEGFSEMNYISSNNLEKNINFNNEDSIDYYNKIKNSKYRKAEVRIKLHKLEEYPSLDLTIGVIMFSEIKTNQRKTVSTTQNYSSDSSKHPALIKTNTSSNNSALIKTSGITKDNSESKGINNKNTTYDRMPSGAITNANNTIFNGIVHQLKEKKALINEQSTPKQISVLKRTMMLIIFLILIFNIVDLIFKLNKIVYSKDMLFSIKNVQKRLATIAEGTFYACKLELIANNKIQNEGTNTENLTKEYLLKINQELKDYQWYSTKAFLTFENYRLEQYNPQKSWYRYLIEKNNEMRIPLKLDAAVYDFVNDIEFQASNKLSDLIRPTEAAPEVNLSHKNYFYIMNNAFEWLRLNNIDLVWNQYNKFYQKNIRFGDIISCYLFMGTVTFLICTFFIIIPNILKIHKSTDNILSLFAYIDLEDIKLLGNNCKKYKEKHLADSYVRKNRYRLSSLSALNSNIDLEDSSKNLSKESLVIKNKLFKLEYEGIAKESLDYSNLNNIEPKKFETTLNIEKESNDFQSSKIDNEINNFFNNKVIDKPDVTKLDFLNDEEPLKDELIVSNKVRKRSFSVKADKDPESAYNYSSNSPKSSKKVQSYYGDESMDIQEGDSNFNIHLNKEFEKQQFFDDISINSKNQSGKKNELDILRDSKKINITDKNEINNNKQSKNLEDTAKNLFTNTGSDYRPTETISNMLETEKADLNPVKIPLFEFESMNPDDMQSNLFLNVKNYESENQSKNEYKRASVTFYEEDKNNEVNEDKNLKSDQLLQNEGDNFSFKNFGTDDQENSTENDKPKKYHESKNTYNSNSPNNKLDFLGKNSDDQNNQLKKRLSILLNSSESKKKATILRFQGIVLLCLATLIGNQVYSRYFTNYSLNANENFLYITQLEINVKYISAATQNSLSTLDYVQVNDTNINTFYIESLYANLKNISWNFKESFPYEFENYKDQFHYQMNDNVCTHFFKSRPEYEFAYCETSEFYTKGFSTMIVKIIEDCRFIANSLSISTNKTSLADKVLREYKALATIETFNIRLTYALDYLVKTFEKSHEESTVNFRNTTIQVIALYILTLISCYVFLWLPYLTSQKHKIWRTSSMLNMIPIDVITKNETLTKTIISNDNEVL